ncbi:MAG: pirin family protein [Candidatus Didemnitutus sp.]|nr:pirin family protein [Candidatus Didemnitutus sp.]
MTRIHRADERGHAQHGWLDSFHSFSFADYHDPRRMGFRSLRVLNDDLVLPGRGFGMHPHRDMEIVTYNLRGSLEHRDSLGNGRVISAGEVQYMAAGTGVQHSEMNPSNSEAVRLLQIWILPDHHGAKPRYAERSMAAAATGCWHLVASKTGRADSMAINQDADLWLAKLRAGDRVTHHPAPGRGVWLQVAEGKLALNGTALREGDAAEITDETALEITATAAAQVLLFDLH